MSRVVAVYTNVPIFCYRVASLSARTVAAEVVLADTRDSAIFWTLDFVGFYLLGHPPSGAAFLRVVPREETQREHGL